MYLLHEGLALQGNWGLVCIFFAVLHETYEGDCIMQRAQGKLWQRVDSSSLDPQIDAVIVSDNSPAATNTNRWCVNTYAALMSYNWITNLRMAKFFGRLHPCADLEHVDVNLQ